tara:strand:+ start:339 stop:461 length:123 start_codon:yes stop_codon:yes gene_type:complete
MSGSWVNWFNITPVSLTCSGIKNKSVNFTRGNVCHFVDSD